MHKISIFRGQRSWAHYSLSSDFLFLSSLFLYVFSYFLFVIFYKYIFLLPVFTSFFDSSDQCVFLFLFADIWYFYLCLCHSRDILKYLFSMVYYLVSDLELFNGLDDGEKSEKFSKSIRRTAISHNQWNLRHFVYAVCFLKICWRFGIFFFSSVFQFSVVVVVYTWRYFSNDKNGIARRAHEFLSAVTRCWW